MKEGAILGFIMAGQTKTEDTTIKPILPTQTDWHEDTKLRALYQALPVLTAEQIYSATKVLRILVAVSYTHLDVYKRQTLVPSKRAVVPASPVFV